MLILIFFLIIFIIFCVFIYFHHHGTILNSFSICQSTSHISKRVYAIIFPGLSDRAGHLSIMSVCSHSIHTKVNILKNKNHHIVVLSRIIKSQVNPMPGHPCLKSKYFKKTEITPYCSS